MNTKTLTLILTIVFLATLATAKPLVKQDSELQLQESELQLQDSELQLQDSKLHTQIVQKSNCWRKRFFKNHVCGCDSYKTITKS